MGAKIRNGEDREKFSIGSKRRVLNASQSFSFRISAHTVRFSPILARLNSKIT